MPLGWSELIKIATVAISTFAIGAFVKPIFLALRDYCVWAAIDAYLKKSNFPKRALIFAKNKAIYNKLSKEPLWFDETNHPGKFWQGEKEITKGKFKEIVSRSQLARNKIASLQRRIDKETSIIGSALRHYKQEGTNPAIAIIQHYEEKEYKIAGLEYKKISR